MESSAAGGDTPPRPWASAGASPPAPPPPPPPPKGWLAGLVSGAGRILAAVLGPEPSASGSGSISSAAASDGDSPSASCSPAWYPPPGPHGEGCNDATGTDSPNCARKVSAFQALPLSASRSLGCRIDAFAVVSNGRAVLLLHSLRAAYRGSDGGSNDRNSLRSSRILVFRLRNSSFLTK
jgi:hypothetical protein